MESESQIGQDLVALKNNSTNSLLYMHSKKFKNIPSIDYFTIPHSIYNILKAQHNSSNFKHDMPETYGQKKFNSNSESFKTCWVDRGILQKTHNYESTQYNFINQSKNPKQNFHNILKANPLDFHRVKSISEFCDISSERSPKKFQEFYDSQLANPTGFAKCVGICAKRCDLIKTYGPFYSITKGLNKV